MAEQHIDLNALTTKRLLALLNAVRQCGWCLRQDYVYPCQVTNCLGHTCPKKHPDIEEIKTVLATREHLAKGDE